MERKGRAKGVGLACTAAGLVLLLVLCVGAVAEQRAANPGEDPASEGEDEPGTDGGAADADPDGGGADDGMQAASPATGADAYDDRSASEGGGRDGRWSDGDEAVESRVEEGGEDVVAKAASVLEGYRDRGDCLLREAGYLDLYGDVWGCVVEAPAWVDVVVVRSTTEGGNTTRTVRMRPDRWEAEFDAL